MLLIYQLIPNSKGETMSKCYVECPQCKEVASVSKNSLTTTIDCECGTIEMDTMVEEDRFYNTYSRFMNQYGDTLSPIFTDKEVL